MKIKFDGIEYNAYDQLNVEVKCRVDEYIWDFGILQRGKQTIQIRADQLYRLEKLCSTKEENDEATACRLSYQSAYKKKKAQLDELYAHPNMATKKEIEWCKWLDANNPVKRFIEDYGHEPKPVETIKVLENLGPSATDTLAMQEKATSTNEQMAKILELLLQERAELKEKLNLAAKQR